MGEQYSILERAKEGDNEAISELYSQNYYAVLGAIRSLVSDQDESMDLLQDAFLKAFANLDQLRGDFTP